MRSIHILRTGLRTGLLGTALAVIAVATPLVSLTGDRVLNDKDIKKLSNELASWFEALDARKGKLDAEEGVREELEKLNKKKGKQLKAGNLLAQPEDLGAVIYMANRYDKKFPKRGAGKVVSKTADGGRGTVEYAVWSPQKYKPKSGPYPLLLTIPDEGENPEKHIMNRWNDGTLRETMLIASPKMPGDSKKWTENDGLAAVLLTLREVSNIYAIDFDRVYIGGRGRGGETALKIANMFPSRWAGAFAWGSDAGEGIPPENMRHIPILICGGGSKSTAFADAAKEAGIESVKLDSGGGQTEIMAWMNDVKRTKYPEEITLIPGERFPTGAYWLQIQPVPDPTGVRLDVSANRESNTITINSKGITEATIYLSDEIVDLDKPVTVIANGVEKVQQFERSFRLVLQLLESGKVDPGRVFVAADTFHIPSAGESDDGAGESDG
ncbi:MAG: hypothetical protein AAF957_04780 [Planctomycetota bacterium]